MQIKAVSAQDEALIADVIALGNRNRRTLGFLPRAAFRQAATSGTLIAAVEGDRLAGYALYGLPGDRVRLTHLCVEDAFRRRGVNRQLVEALSLRHADRLGIVLKCRKDYGLDKMWARLGFEPRTEVDGRGGTREPLVVWWRSHGHPDLFTDLESTALVIAAMDCNTFADLHSSYPRNGAEETKALSAHWLTGLLELVVLPQLVDEVQAIRQVGERRAQLNALSYYRRPAPQNSDGNRLLQTLIRAAQDDLRLLLPPTANDLKDLAYVVQARASGLSHLITRDAGLLALSPVAEKVCGVRILRPADSVVAIDELRRAQVYQPGSLLGTNLTTTAVPAGHEQQQTAFLNKPDGERQNAFKARLRELAARPDQWDRQQITSGDGTLLATYCYGVRDRELHVPLLRVNEMHPLGETLARQLLFLLRQHCRREKVEVLRLTDPSPQRTLRAAAQEDAFQQTDAGLVALVLDRIVDTAGADAHAATLAAQLGISLPRFSAPLPPAAASAVEHAWWPLKITDAQLPTFLVPVRPRWAYELFGVPEGIVSRDDRLGLSREHVYYRSPRSRGETAPARILWYASSDRTHGMSAVIGCSRLDQRVIDDGEQLYRQFKHLGVYRHRDVLKICDEHGQAMALRFSDTGLFPHAVPYKRLVALGARYGQSINVQSVLKISPDLFRALYQEGHPSR
ncbi:GNAT family N-acetyltransferase [Streptomyces sp. BF23-18]|uniref:GNAT family N-acetyltransferase n=1 Tax=Streptomyces sp. BF23-18 TaxID=3240282 RepID=UPI0034E60E7F